MCWACATSTSGAVVARPHTGHGKDYAAGYVTPLMRAWVDRIRAHGNQATHDLDPPSRDRAESTLTFTAQMLKNTYGMEYLVKKHAPAA